MFRVIETFSGIGSQAKALKNIGVEHEIVITSEWDFNAIIAYDLIHNGIQNLKKYENYSSTEINEILGEYTLSADGKKPMSKKSLQRLSSEVKQRLLCAIERSKNKVSITDIKGKDIPKDIDLLTYSFPCQDLSICGFWHGNNTGIDRNANNRSGMLWEVERILKEMVLNNQKPPKFLLMENVTNILSKNHKENFDEWKNFLRGIGYCNKIYRLNAINFGIPQKRKRAYMISVLCEKDSVQEMNIMNYFKEHDLQEKKEADRLRRRNISLNDILRLNYDENKYYLEEANYSQPNDTPSRKSIYENNVILFDGNEIKDIAINTLTTKQDRHPNSGVIDYNSGRIEKALYRNLTPRECFMLMGFEENDYQILIDNNFNTNIKRKFFTREKLIKMAGNSVVVDVLEVIFKQVLEINELFDS